MLFGIEVGGWFLFEKTHSWSYRSNGFFEIEESQVIGREQNQLLAFFFQKKINGAYRLRTLIERVWGVWKL